MYGNPYYTQPRFQPMTNQQMINQPLPQQNFIPPITQPTQQVGLLGKIVENIEMVRISEIPLDGSISYFPLSDGSGIVTKQLMTDGTSKLVVYKPVEEDKKDEPKYVTFEEFEKALDDIDLQDIRDDIKELKRQLNKKNKED